MSETLAGDPDADWEDLTIPDDGDDEDASSVDVAFETLANRTAYLKALRHQVSSVFRNCNKAWGDEHWSDYQAITGLAGGMGWIMSDADPGEDNSLWFDVDVPHGCVITNIGVKIKPSSAHGVLPPNMPRIQLFEIDSNGSAVQIFSLTDPTGSIAAYEARHDLTKIGLTVPVDKIDKRYVLAFSGEWGLGARDGLTVNRCRVRYSMTHLDEGGA